MSRVARLMMIAVLVITGLAATAVPGNNGTAQAQISNAYEGRYIVLLDEHVDPRRFVRNAQRTDYFSTDHVYETAVVGFSARLSPRQLHRVERMRSVVAILPDERVDLDAQTVPWGIDRVGTLDSGLANVDGVDTELDVDIAILDTGLDKDHPDLNVAGGYNCMSGGQNAWDDGNGHGSHVAGTAAAKDNDFGVVGVAPGARVWGIKVFDDSGSGTVSSVICGFDWVTLNANMIDVANLSGSASGSNSANCGYGNWWTRDSFHQAVCAAYDAGVTVVTAAGNSGANASNTRPATYPETIAVGATDQNDNRASFSNYGSTVDLYAPGVSVYSTYMNGGYATMSGTSMSSPHGAGAAALYLLENPGASPENVRQGLVDAGDPINIDCCGQPLVYVGNFGPSEPPPPPEPDHDIAVNSVSATSSMLTGESTDITVEVYNDGNQTESNVTVTVEINNSVYDTEDIASIAPGQTRNVIFEDWTPATSGNYQIEASATVPNDSDPGNNSASTTVNVTDPVTDLTITDMSATSPVIQGSASTVQVTVRNDSTQSEDVTVDLTSNPANPAANVSPQTVSVGEGGSHTFSFNWETSESTSATDHNIQATASAGGTQYDSATRTVTVNEPPDVQEMWVESLTASRSSSGWFSSVNGEVTIHSTGGAPVAGAAVQVRIQGTWVNSVQTVTTNQNGVASFSRSLYFGSYTITVEDVSANGYEYNESLNNVTSITV